MTPRSWAAAGGEGSGNQQPSTKANLQPATADIESKSQTQCFYQPAFIPGLLQTPTYASRIFASGPDGAPNNLAERVEGRMTRQSILSDEAKTLRFVVTESALRWPVGLWSEQLEQLERLRETMAKYPHLDIRILPEAPTLVWHGDGFVIYDEVTDGEPFVHVELPTRPVNVEEPEQVDFYRRVFSNLVRVSLADDDAIRLLTQVVEHIRATHT
jgi:hypothetical protein